MSFCTKIQEYNDLVFANPLKDEFFYRLFYFPEEGWIFFSFMEVQKILDFFYLVSAKPLFL
jgi:hypothetical protein